MKIPEIKTKIQFGPDTIADVGGDHEFSTIRGASDRYLGLHANDVVLGVVAGAANFYLRVLAKPTVFQVDDVTDALAHRFGWSSAAQVLLTIATCYPQGVPGGKACFVRLAPKKVGKTSESPLVRVQLTADQMKAVQEGRMTANVRRFTQERQLVFGEAFRAFHQPDDVGLLLEATRDTVITTFGAVFHTDALAAGGKDVNELFTQIRRYPRYEGVKKSDKCCVILFKRVT
jgi:hypothetical protein